MIYQGWEFVFYHLLSIVVISASMAFVEYRTVKLIDKYFGVSAGHTVAIIVSSIHLILILIDSFLFSRFGKVLNQDTLYILAETNRRESTEFIKTYTSAGFLCVAILIIVGIGFLTIRLYSQIIKKMLYIILLLLATGGLFLVCYGSYSFISKGDGLGIPQYSALTRCLYGYYSLRQIASRNRQLEDACRNLHCVLPVEADTIPHIVIVIGESSSYYHCSVYDYDKPTWPCMEARQEAGELIAYQNVTTPYDATNWVMRSVFSLNVSNFGNTPIFPAIFHATGYRTSIIENQYFIGDGLTFLCDRGLSDLVFDSRIDGPFQYDSELLSYIEPQEGLSLDIIHLIGQHLAYQERYPQSFEKFHADDYEPTRFNDQQRKVIAQYDNAGLYCDFVLDKIIQKYESQDCLLIFFSDHGEEVFETRDFCGHASSSTAPAPSYLYKIPFFVWESSFFREKHPLIMEQFMSESTKVFCTSQFSRWIVQKTGLSEYLSVRGL